MRTTALALILAVAASAQDAKRPDVRLAEVRHEKGVATVLGATDLPDDTVLSVFVVAEPEIISHGREIRIVPQLESAPIASLATSVSKKAFQVKFDLKRQGYYRITIVFNRAAQLYEEVLEAIGKTPDCSWPEAFLLIDTPALPALLEEHAPEVLEWIAKAERMQAAIDKEMEDPDAWAERADEVLKEAHLLAGAAGRYARTTPYNACMDTVVQVLVKMANFHPKVQKPNFKPGSAEEAMALNMTEDIPGELSDSFLKKQILAYLARARAAVIRERLLAPLRIAKGEWENLLVRLKNLKARDREIALVRKRYDEAAAACLANVANIKADKTAAKQAGDEFLKSTESIVKAMTALVDERAAMREEAGEAEAAAEAEVRRTFVTLDQALRLIPRFR